MPISASPKYNFKKSFPIIAKQWSQRNERGPEEYTPKSGKKVWWQCARGHEWEAVISSRASGCGCPYCEGLLVTKETSLAARYPELAREWDQNKNKSVKPEDILPGIAKKYWWICPEGHSFEASPNNRTSNNRGCPYCVNQKVSLENSLFALKPQLARGFSTRNLPVTAKDISPGSNRKYWWRCDEGHEWQAVVNSRANADAGCGYCKNRRVSSTNSLACAYPAIAEEWCYEKNGELKPEDIVKHSSTGVWWKCIRGHIYKTSVAHRTLSGTKCPKCTNQTSRNELRIFAELKYIFPNAINRHKCNDIEVDIFLEKEKIGIEYDGSYFHENKTDNDLRKNKLLKNIGITLVRVRQHPLESISSLDVIIAKPNIQKGDINELLMSIQKQLKKPLPKLAEYIGSEGFINASEWQNLIEAMPGPEKSRSLATNDKLVGEWNYEKNSPLKPEDVFLNSGMTVWWRCVKGHEWQDTVDHRARNRNCPYCSNKRVGYGNSLKEQFPQISKEWFKEANGDLTPAQVTSGSGNIVWWKCKRGHIFKAKVADRTRRLSKCLHCPGPGRGRVYVEPDWRQKK